MQRIPIPFEHKGISYQGVLINIAGAGNTGSVFHLMINNFYKGTLMYTNTWVFHSNNGMFNDMADEFGYFVMAWYG